MIDSELLIPRPRYMERLLPLVDAPVIKVLTGVRRSGKSTIMHMLRERIERDNPEATFVHVNFESVVGAGITDYRELLSYVSAKTAPSQRTYFFFDEIQQVDQWEKAVNALRVDYNCDIYLTGSNATLLSGDLATRLAGRYVDFHVHPLSFSEFVALHADRFGSPREAFSTYVAYGGYPELKYFGFAREPSLDYLRSVYDSTVLRDVIEYHHIRDVDAFHRIVEYGLRNVGMSFSARSLEKFFKSENRTVSADTILSYLSYCQQAYLFFKAPRADVQGKAQLRSNEKYYCADHGLREVVGASNSANIELVLENIVYLELLSRGWDVSVGVVGDYEVDFVATRGSEREYFQVCYMLANEDTALREFRSLEQIGDNFPKTVLSLDDFDRSRGGIAHLNLIDFLLAVP